MAAKFAGLSYYRSHLAPNEMLLRRGTRDVFWSLQLAKDGEKKPSSSWQ
jgi:hypothetical protein